MKGNVRSVIIAGSLSLALAVITARAATNSWTGGSDKWENYADWSVGHPPSLNDTADLITGTGNNTVTIDETTVDPDGFSGTGGTCPCQPNTVQLRMENVFSNGDVWSALLYRNGYGSWTTNIGYVAYRAEWHQYSSNTGWWVGKLVFGGYYTVGSTSPYLTQPCDYSAHWSYGSTFYTVSYPYNGCQDWVPPGWMTINNLTVSAPAGSTSELDLFYARPVPLVVNDNLTVDNNGNLDITDSSVFVTNTATGLGNVSIGVDGTNALVSLVFGGVLVDQTGCVGCSNYMGNGASNVAYVGFNSLWSNAVLHVGQFGRYNQLIIDQSGEVDQYGDQGLMVGDDYSDPGSSPGGYNTIVVGGPAYPGAPGSVLNISGGTLGYVSPGNQMIITNGGSVIIHPVYQGSGYLSVGFFSDNNTLIVTDPGSILSNTCMNPYAGCGGPSVGFQGSGNQMIVANGGRVVGLGGGIGEEVYAYNNAVVVTGSNSDWDMAGGGLLIGNGGAGNRLTIANGALVCDDNVTLGFQFGFGYSNAVLVTDPGSVWSNASWMDIGSACPGNQMTITNGGHVYSQSAIVGNSLSSGGGRSCNNNTVLVTDSGSIWGNQSNLTVGYYGSGNQLIITNGGLAYNGHAYLGMINYTNATGIIYFADHNSVLVAGNGSVWSNTGNVYLGNEGPTNQLTITTGGSAIASNAYVGYHSNSIGNQITITSGSLSVVNALGTGVLDIRGGTLTFNGGTVTVNQLMLTNGAGSRMNFTSGTLTSSGTSVTNGLEFVVGDGVHAATFHLSGGVHAFNNGLRIKNNAVVNGCGTISGTITVDSGGQNNVSCP